MTPAARRAVAEIYVGRHRGTEFPDSSGHGWIFSAYVGKHRDES